MSVAEQIKILRANYAVKFTLPIVYSQHYEALKAAEAEAPEDEREAARKQFIETHHDLKLVVSRLSDEEKKGAGRALLKAEGNIAGLEAYHNDMWQKIRRHVEKGYERGTDGNFSEVKKETLGELLDMLKKYDEDCVSFIINAYNEAERADAKKAEADKDFLAPAS